MYHVCNAEVDGKFIWHIYPGHLDNDGIISWNITGEEARRHKIRRSVYHTCTTEYTEGGKCVNCGKTTQLGIPMKSGSGWRRNDEYWPMDLLLFDTNGTWCLGCSNIPQLIEKELCNNGILVEESNWINLHKWIRNTYPNTLDFASSKWPTSISTKLSAELSAWANLPNPWILSEAERLQPPSFVAPEATHCCYWNVKNVISE